MYGQVCAEIDDMLDEAMGSTTEEEEEEVGERMRVRTLSSSPRYLNNQLVTDVFRL